MLLGKTVGVASQQLTYLLTLLGFILRTISKKVFICSKNLIDMSNVETRPLFFSLISVNSLLICFNLVLDYLYR